MQAAPARATAVLPVPSVIPAGLPSVTDALRAVESVLMRGGQRTARRNAWTSVLEDRRRARDRREALHVLEAVASEGPSAT
ncbi:hypothetical protein [Streptomyces sp. MST-110588]|uniref:SCO2195 family GlnR-regulated protein n=1 Tax=Streptomyces sp. MST-110588 TaxID=2833628 RepID=UPI001F5C8777|nr:hypothetical protein [Streptomyces sp. MST-110588]UNO42479.1 hypothetical protein KGS77_26810 [Streptomyces sp. MST-110588]